MIEELGKRLTAPKAALLIEMDVNRLRKRYKEYGGFLEGNRIYFYEVSIRNAIQNKIKKSMDCAGEDRRENVYPQVQNENRGNRMGGDEEKPRRKRGRPPGTAKIDPHGILA